MTLLKDNNYKEINVALLSLEADIKNKITNFDTSVIDKQLAEINSRIDKINAGGNNTSAAINDIRYEIEDINSKLNGNSAKIENIEQKLSDIFSAENKVTDFNTTTDSGIYYWTTDAANKPGTEYGVLLVNKYDRGDNNSIWINQVAYGTNNKIYFRQNINSGSWTEWKAVAFEGEGKANFLDEYPGAGGTRLTSGNIVPKDSSEYGGMRKDVVTSSMTDGSRPGSDGHLLTMFWDSTARYDSQLFIANDNGVPVALKVRQKQGGADYGPWVDVITSNNIGSQTVASAGNADTVDNYHASDLWRSDGATWNPSANVTMTPSGNDSEWSFDFRNKNGATGTYWQVWDENKQTLLKVDADSGKVSAPYGFVGNLSGKADTAGTADYARNMYYQNLDLSALDKTKFYPLVCYSGTDFAEVAICSESGMASMDYNQNRIHFDISTFGWSDLSPTLNIREYACYDNNEVTIGCIGRGNHNGAWAIWLRGGLHYTCFSRNSDLTLHTSDYTFGDETYTVGTNYYGGSNTNVGIMFTPQSTITEGAYSSRPITAPSIKANGNITLDGDGGENLASYGSEPLSIGFPSGTGDGQSLGIDRNSMQVRINGAASNMYLNFYGGMVSVNEQNQSNGGLKVKQKMVIPIGAPSSLEDGCIWIS